MKVLFFQFFGLAYFLFWCFTSFLLKPIEKNNKFFFTKKTKYSVYIRLIFYSDFIEAFCSANIFKKFFRNPINLTNQLQNIVKLFLHFFRLTKIEIREIILKKTNISDHQKSYLKR